MSIWSCRAALAALVSRWHPTTFKLVRDFIVARMASVASVHFQQYLHEQTRLCHFQKHLFPVT